MANILIIDDDSAVRDYLATLVTRLGHTAHPAATCADGIAKMADPAVEVIIADIHLPDSPPMAEWIDQLKQHASGRPIIVITGEPHEEVDSRVQRGELAAFLTKPFELAFIKNLLAKVTQPEA